MRSVREVRGATRTESIGVDSEPLLERSEQLGVLKSELNVVAGSGRVEYVEWPPEKKAIDIGSFYADSTKFKRTTGWTPTVFLADGLRRTVEFYRAHFSEYVPDEPDAERV